MNSTLILNAKVVNEGAVTENDVLIKGQRIEKIGPGLQSMPAGKVVDAKGKFLLPGAIDDQVHFREPGLTHKATIYTESRAAVAGGVTSFMEMPNTIPPAFTQQLLEDKYQIASKTSLGNYSFYMGASNDNLEEVLKTDIRRVCGLKIFMGSSTGNLLVDNVKTLDQPNEWLNFKLNKQLLLAVEEAGFAQPTEIQRKCIPLILGGQQVIGIAQTGTGKTAAYLLPVLMKTKFAQGQNPRALVLAPTKELVVQITQHAQALSKKTDLRIVPLYGGIGATGQISELKSGTDILVATPGRFMDLYLKNEIPVKDIRTLVIDEADRMMDMGFIHQLRKVFEVLPVRRQNLLFSATFPEKVEKLSVDFLANTYDEAVYVQLSSADYHERKEGGMFNREEFHQAPQHYKGTFIRYARVADLLIAGAFWNPKAPVLFTKEEMKGPGFKLKIIADVTCDIEGSIPSTKRPSTIADPIYDYDPATDRVEPPLSNPGFITVMAVDNLPCELPRSASEEFGRDLIDKIIPALVIADKDGVLKRASITRGGKLTENFLYLSDYVMG